MARYFTETGKWAPPTTHRGGDRSKKKAAELEQKSRENLEKHGFNPELAKTGPVTGWRNQTMDTERKLTIKTPPKIFPITAATFKKGDDVTTSKLNDIANKQNTADSVATQAIYDAVAKTGGPGADALLQRIKLIQQGGVTPSEMGVVLQDLLNWIFGSATALKNEVVSVRAKAHGLAAQVKGLQEKIQSVPDQANTIDETCEKLTQAGIFSTGSISEDLAHGSIFLPNGYRIDFGTVVTLLAGMRMAYLSEPLPEDASLVDWLFSRGKPMSKDTHVILSEGDTWERMQLSPRGKPVDTFLHAIDIDTVTGTVALIDEATATSAVPAGKKRWIVSSYQPEIGLNLRRILPLLGSIGLLSIGHAASSVASAFTPGLLGILGFSKVGAFASADK